MVFVAKKSAYEGFEGQLVRLGSVGVAKAEDPAVLRLSHCCKNVWG